MEHNLGLFQQKAKMWSIYSPALSSLEVLQGILAQLLPIWPVQGQSMVLCPKIAHWRKGAGISCHVWEMSAEKLWDRPKGCGGGSANTIYTWLFVPSLISKMMLSQYCFHLHSLMSGNFWPNFIFASLFETQVFKHLNTVSFRVGYFLGLGQPTSIIEKKFQSVYLKYVCIGMEWDGIGEQGKLFQVN